jgi:hypothetical protein
VYYVCSKYLLFIFENKKGKGVINGMAVNELGMGFARIHDFRKIS